MYYGSARYPTESIVKVSIAVPLLNSLTSILCGLVVFSFVGHISQKYDIPIDQISDGGLDLAFVAFPGLIALFDKVNANWWAIMFFLMLICLGVDSAFGLMDFQIQFLLDSFPAIQQKMRKEAFAAIFCSVCFCCSLIFCLDSGYYYFAMFDTYACGISLFVVLIAECVFLGWFLGVDKLSKLMNLRTGETIPTYVQVCFKYVIPAFISAMLLFSVIAEFSTDRDLPFVLLWAFRLLFIIPIVAVPLGMLKKVECDDIFELIMRDDKVWMDGHIKRSASFREQEQV
jgi:SNF family Na+-dependent transporter